jgi:hypothetical protein
MEAIFSSSVKTGPGAHPASYTMRTGSFPGVNRPDRGVDHTLRPSAELEEGLQLTRLDLRGLFYGKFTFVLPLHIFHVVRHL